MKTALTLHVQTDDDGAVSLQSVGEIDLSNVESFAAALDDAMSRGAGTVTVDLTGVNYLDSAAINALFTHADHIRIVANRLLTAILNLSGLADLVAVEIVGGGS